MLCVCVYTLSPAGFFWLQDVRDMSEMFGSAIFCCEYCYGPLPSSFFSISESIIFHLQRHNSSRPTKLERKRYGILESCEKMINIDIGYKAAMHKVVKLRKDTKEKEATLI